MSKFPNMPGYLLTPKGEVKAFLPNPPGSLQTGKAKMFGNIMKLKRPLPFVPSQLLYKSVPCKHELELIPVTPAPPPAIYRDE